MYKRKRKNYQSIKRKLKKFRVKKISHAEVYHVCVHVIPVYVSGVLELKIPNLNQPSTSELNQRARSGGSLSFLKIY